MINFKGGDMRKKSIQGLTFYIAFGSYGGFHFDRTGICLGYVSVRIMDIDIENVLETLMLENKKLKNFKRG